MFFNEYSFAFFLSLSISSLLILVSLFISSSLSQANLIMSVGFSFFLLFTYAII
nr:MAG TPA: hypothetical protein [Caudoviricetes sp.]